MLNSKRLGDYNTLPTGNIFSFVVQLSKIVVSENRLLTLELLRHTEFVSKKSKIVPQLCCVMTQYMHWMLFFVRVKRETQLYLHIMCSFSEHLQLQVAACGVADRALSSK